MITNQNCQNCFFPSWKLSWRKRLSWRGTKGLCHNFNENKKVLTLLKFKICKKFSIFRINSASILFESETEEDCPLIRFSQISNRIWLDLHPKYVECEWVWRLQLRQSQNMLFLHFVLTNESFKPSLMFGLSLLSFDWKSSKLDFRRFNVNTSNFGRFFY